VVTQPLDPALLARARCHLESFTRRVLPTGDLRHAAVAVTLLSGDGGRPCFVLTLRAPRLRTHAGQWALPGGRIDPGETAEEAARRELHEELGLPVGPDAVLGLLDDYPTRSGYLITPVVIHAGTAGPLVANPMEVASAHLVPLADLDAPGVPRFVAIPESDRPVIQIPLVGTLIHAPTAAVLYQLREVALYGRPTRVAHLEQPVFAWR
jgi:8-oxo-dGTP pyrophosphatase MutT (NUDIX family)